MVPYRKLFEELERRCIRYLVAGGFAVNFHQVQRATVDLDLILDLEQSNALAFVQMMSDLGYRPKIPVQAEDFADASLREKWIEEKGMMVFSFMHAQNLLETIDVFVREPRPFGELWDRRFEVRAFDLTIRVLGREDLITLKREAGREKDNFDIRELERIP